MHILNDALLDKIEIAKRRIDQRRLDEFVRDMFNCFSKEVRRNVSIQDDDNAQRKDEVLTNLETAWDYADKNFSGSVDRVFLSDVCGRVEPSLCVPGQTYASFRDTTAQPIFGYMPPIDKSRIDNHLERTLEAVESNSWHHIEKAVYLDFHLTRIQPFLNGNKRTANLVMNSLLKNNGFFPISISPRQIGRFEGYMAGALRDFNESSSNSSDYNQPYQFPGHSQRQLFDFLARIELSALNCAEDKMAFLSHYNISFNHTQPNCLYSIKHKVSSWLKAHNLLHQVKLDVRNRSMEVIGDIPRYHLERSLGQVKGLGDYKLTSDAYNK